MTQQPDHFHLPANCPTASARSDADDRAARDHIRDLRERGASYRPIARAAGTGATTVHAIATRRWQPTPGVATACSGSVPSPRRRRESTPAEPRLRLRALHVMRHGSARLARAVGASEKTIRALVNGDAKTVSTRIRDAVITVYNRWLDKRAPERTRAERAAARAAGRHAIADNWCAAAALDDDKLDTPATSPPTAGDPPPEPASEPTSIRSGRRR